MSAVTVSFSGFIPGSTGKTLQGMIRTCGRPSNGFSGTTISASPTGTYAPK